MTENNKTNILIPVPSKQKVSLCPLQLALFASLLCGLCCTKLCCSSCPQHSVSSNRAMFGTTPDCHWKDSFHVDKAHPYPMFSQNGRFLFLICMSFAYVDFEYGCATIQNLTLFCYVPQELGHYELCICVYLWPFWCLNHVIERLECFLTGLI